MSEQIDIQLGENPLFLARIEKKEDNTLLLPSEVEKISYSIYQWKDPLFAGNKTIVPGHDTVNVPLRNLLQQSLLNHNIWPVNEDATPENDGYNFIFEPSSREKPLFPSLGLYEVVFTFTLTDKNPICFRYRINVN